MATDDLFLQKPSFLRGVARALDLGATMQRDSYRVSKTPDEADYRAIKNDWGMVGEDLRGAMATVLETARR